MMNFDHGYALLIGIGEIANKPQWSLPVTIHDVEALKILLVDPHICAYPDTEQHVRLLSNMMATQQDILDGLDWLSACAKQDNEATILFFYSGHGWVDNETGNYYLIQNDVNPDNLVGTALSAQIITEKLQAIEAQRLLAIFDCCHAQGIATSKEGITGEAQIPEHVSVEAIPKTMITALKQGAGRAVFTSSLGHQLSWTRNSTISLYTYHLLEALQGAGNKPGDTTVRLSNLMNHLGVAVPSSAQTMGEVQTPFFDTASEDFPIAVLLGGKGLGANGWVDEASTAQGKIDRIVQTIGDRRVDITGNVTGSTIISGNNNQVNQGKYTIEAETVTSSAIGDGAHVTNAGTVTILGGQIFGAVTGINNGSMTSHYDQLSASIQSVPSLQSVIDQAHATLPTIRDEETSDGIHMIILHLKAALRAETKGDKVMRTSKLREAQTIIRILTVTHSELASLQQQINYL